MKEKTRTRTPLTHIRKVKENLTLASTMEQRKMLKWQTKWSGSKKLELKKYFEKKKERKGVHLAIEFWSFKAKFHFAGWPLKSLEQEHQCDDRMVSTISSIYSDFGLQLQGYPQIFFFKIEVIDQLIIQLRGNELWKIEWNDKNLIG